MSLYRRGRRFVGPNIGAIYPCYPLRSSGLWLAQLKEFSHPNDAPSRALLLRYPVNSRSVPSSNSHPERQRLTFAGISAKRSLGIAQKELRFAQVQGGGASTGGTGGGKSWQIRLTDLHLLAYVPATKQFDGQTGPDRGSKQKARMFTSAMNGQLYFNRGSNSDVLALFFQITLNSLQ